MQIRTLQDLKCRGVKFSDELEERFIKEVLARYHGESKSPINEPLDEIIANVYTAISLEQQLK